jgi:hypothetical protein
LHIQQVRTGPLTDQEQDMDALNMIVLDSGLQCIAT